MDRALEQMLRSSQDQGPERACPPATLISLLLKRWYSDQERSAALRRMLLHCLSHLEPEHAEQLRHEHRQQLYFELQRKRNDPYLVTAILRGLAGMEDTAAIPYVVPLAEGKRSAAEFPQLQAAARECLFKLGYFG
jgi:hypothetical protein